MTSQIRVSAADTAAAGASTNCFWTVVHSSLYRACCSADSGWMPSASTRCCRAVSSAAAFREPSSLASRSYSGPNWRRIRICRSSTGPSTTMAATTMTAMMMPTIAPVDIVTSMRCRNRRFDSPGWAGLNETTVRDLSGHQRRVTTLEADHLHRAGSACHPVGACRVASSGSDPGDEGGLTKGRLAAFLTALAGSAVLGIVAGLIWAAVAPRPLLQEIAHGEAEVVNAETTAYIVADAWFALIAAVGGL